MSNFLCVVSDKSINDTSIIYGAELRIIKPDDIIARKLNRQTLFYYKLATENNYEKIIQAKSVCPQFYKETEKMFNSIYYLAEKFKEDGNFLALYLTCYGQELNEFDWDITFLKSKKLLSENLEFEFGILYIIA